jgi:hypothetical protein
MRSANFTPKRGDPVEQNQAPEFKVEVTKVAKGTAKPQGAKATGVFKIDVTHKRNAKPSSARAATPAPEAPPRRDLSALSLDELSEAAQAAKAEELAAEVALLEAQANYLDGRASSGGALISQLRTSPAIDVAEARHKRAKASAIEIMIACEQAQVRVWEAAAAERRKPRSSREVTATETLASAAPIEPGRSVRLDYAFPRDLHILRGAVSPEVASGFVVDESSIGLRLLGPIEPRNQPCGKLFSFLGDDGKPRDWPASDDHSVVGREGQVLSLTVRNTSDQPLAFAVELAFGDVSADWDSLAERRR